ncbi:MAG: glycoside hydrolase family 2 [Verrucomicrobia bacterium]|nr:glycoside hydrolase family 2 [Verrucomicrobiota bacterium]
MLDQSAGPPVSAVDLRSSDYPRPQCRRSTWHSLDGPWECAFDPQRLWAVPAEVRFDREIVVPYAPETPRSGINDQNFHPVIWYQRRFNIDSPAAHRVFLHFGAVDYSAQAWVNDQLVAQHVGGHTPFTVELTSLAKPASELVVVVRAEDDPAALDQPRGKQDWQLKPHSIWYPRTTGIWQTVWLEYTPLTFVRRIDWTPQLESFSLALDVAVDGPIQREDALRVELFVRDKPLLDDTYRLHGSSQRRALHLPDGGLYDVRRELFWSPEHPQLIDARITLLREGVPLDVVTSYTALRTVGSEEGAFLLNGLPYRMRLVLDQGYWPEGGLSATWEELRRDVILTKQLGFNGVRKHQKIEDPRFLYWCDILGLLVWEEMPSAYQFSARAVEAITAEWLEAIARDRSHPCIVAWVPFNESWGLPDLGTNPQTRAFCRGLFHLTKSMDPTRLVVGNDGWEHLETDLLTVHDYTDDPDVLLERYGSLTKIGYTLDYVRPARRRLLLLNPPPVKDRLPVLLTEFGGIAYAVSEEGWGYSRARSEKGLLTRYAALLKALNECEDLAGFCYTQLTDTYQEINGLLTADREFKSDPSAIAAETLGARSAQEREADPHPNPLGYAKAWREKYALLVEEITPPTGPRQESETPASTSTLREGVPKPE